MIFHPLPAGTGNGATTGQIHTELSALVIWIILKSEIKISSLRRWQNIVKKSLAAEEQQNGPNEW